MACFQQILCPEAAASTVGAGGSSPCRKGVCRCACVRACVCVCVYRTARAPAGPSCNKECGVTSLQANMGQFLSRPRQDRFEEEVEGRQT